MPISLVFCICGLLMPIIEVAIFKDDFFTSFPWELYLAFAYLALGLFFEFDEVLTYLVFGYAISRLIIYFKVRPKSTSEL